ncbi:MAG TPA: nitroreductase family deazaflavin-dependent oxidoreductase [Thermomicrobiaceae bacterium]|nr:nitroreductase family deazaflavin-dependent oxidoreductase [Thermomicrobiaceae bacterium]
MSSSASPVNYNQQIIEEFRANHGKLGGDWAGVPLLLLTSTGAKTGKPRTTPVDYTRDGDRLVIIASKGGAPTNPDWYHNLLANPVATVELGDETFKVRATPAQGEERERLFDQHAAQLPVFAGYRTKTTRQIPVPILERVD